MVLKQEDEFENEYLIKIFENIEGEDI